MIFNAIYSIALHAMQARLRAVGLALNLEAPTCEFWSDRREEHDSTCSIADCAFVDDEFHMFACSTAQRFSESAPRLLSVLGETFPPLNHEINWSRGKTEALVQYRGHKYQHALDSHMHEGDLSFPVPGSERHLMVVD
eukprot:744720-Pyramimonas_sp.AAC.1